MAHDLNKKISFSRKFHLPTDSVYGVINLLKTKTLVYFLFLL